MKGSLAPILAVDIEEQLVTLLLISWPPVRRCGRTPSKAGANGYYKKRPSHFYFTRGQRDGFRKNIDNFLKDGRKMETRS